MFAQINLQGAFEMSALSLHYCMLSAVNAANWSMDASYMLLNAVPNIQLKDLNYNNEQNIVKTP